MRVLFFVINVDWHNFLKNLITNKFKNVEFDEVNNLTDFKNHIDSTPGRYKLIVSELNYNVERLNAIKDAYKSQPMAYNISFISDQKDYKSNLHLQNSEKRRLRLIHISTHTPHGISDNRVFISKVLETFPDIQRHLKNKRTLLFVHGFGGSKKSWKKLETLIGRDSDLKNKYTIDHYQYPTPKFELGIFTSFINPNYYLGIKKLSGGLNTKVTSVLRQSESIILIGHSMGGLVIRNYLTDYLTSQHQEKIEHLIQFSSPNAGTNFSKFKMVLWKSQQLKDLKPDSIFLQELNSKWDAKDLINKVPNIAFIPLQDNIVNDKSGKAFIGEYTEYPNKRHSTIINLKSLTDPVYKDFKSVLERIKYS